MNIHQVEKMLHALVRERESRNVFFEQHKKMSPNELNEFIKILSDERNMIIQTQVLTSEEMINAVGWDIKDMKEVSMRISFDSKYKCIIIPLPRCNKEWTLDAYKWTDQFCAIHEKAFPVHYDSLETHNFIYINVEQYNLIK